MSATKEKIIVEVERREGTGKNACRRLRAAGRVPANVYGLDLAPFAVAVDPKRVEDLLRLASGRNTILTLSMGAGGQSREVMLRELQRDPLSERLVHVDFLRVDPTQQIRVQVPIHLTGTPEGVKNEAGILDFIQREVEIACLPADIPSYLEVDVSHLHINQNVALKDVEVPAGAEFVDDPETILAVVAVSRAEVVAEEAEVEGEEAEAAESEDGEKGKEAEGEPEGSGS